MKTIKDLFELVGKATEQNGKTYNQWFFDFSGHVNKMKVEYFPTGWKENYAPTISEKIDQVLNEEGIQALYWFIKTRLKREKSGKELFEAWADGTTYAPLK